MNDETMKNEYFFKLVEAIRFAKMQHDKLGDTTVYNRHIIKVLPEMNEMLDKLYTMGMDNTELAPAAQKYFEFVRSVNDPQHTADMRKLRGHKGFDDICKKYED